MKHQISFRSWYEVNFKKCYAPKEISDSEKIWLAEWFKLVQSLERVSRDSLWGEAIYKVVGRWCKISEVIALVQQLRSQNGDNPAAMATILGKEYLTIINSIIVPIEIKFKIPAAAPLKTVAGLV